MSRLPLDGAPLKICVVSHQAYGALTGSGGYLGGVEHQTALLARWLAARGHLVSLITWDEGQAHGAIVDGVTMLKVCRRDSGWPVTRFVHPRWTSLVAALRAADAHVYYHNSGESVTGQVALWCRARGRKFVYSTASDGDCDPRLPFLTTRRERVLYRAGLRRANRIVVQTERQRRLLRAGFGLDAVPIPMPCVDSGADAAAGTPARRHRIAWIGRLCEVKRPDRLLDLAARCPELTFDLVGPEDGSAYARSVVQRAAQVPNVRVHGAVARSEVSRLLRETICLCCTSDLEGFPNTFLEAWSHGVPTLSTFDPDEVIARHGLGEVVTDVADLPARLRSLLAPGRWRRASKLARRYYRETHTLEATMPRFEAVFREVAAESLR